LIPTAGADIEGADARPYISGMTLRKLARMGHPVLLRVAEPVSAPGAPEVQALIDDMLQTMADAEGIGLAAPQVYAGLRLILATEIAERGQSAAAPVRVLINPELEPVGEEMESAFEGCLSIPELRGLVPRWRSVAYRAVDREGQPVAGTADGLFARILQHEVDHLDGILFPMRMRDLRHLTFTSELQHHAQWLREEAE
jgi:peptide deformylase